MIHLPYPAWMLLVLPLAVMVWLWTPPSRWLLALRILLLALIVLALGGVSVRLPSRRGTLVVLLDRSLSMPPDSELRQAEVIRRLEREKPAGSDLIAVSFGETAVMEHSSRTGEFAGFAADVGRHGSSYALALETALSWIPDEAPGRILVVGDGRFTGADPLSAAAAGAARGVPMDYRLLSRPRAGDLAIEAVDAASPVRPGGGFLMHAWIESPSRQELEYELLRDGQRIAGGRREVDRGRSRLTFRDLASRPGAVEYSLTVRGSSPDPLSENNTARFFVGVSGTRPILHVSRGPDSALARLLESASVPIRTLPPAEARFTLADLSACSAVLLENIPAQEIGDPAMERLALWVRESGGGLWMTGGRRSFGPGGFFKSPLDPILPVAMELRREHRKVAVALVVALDRSGSMAAAAGPGRTKMDLANLAAVEALDLLSPMDEFGAIAVDSRAHVVADLAPVAETDRVRGRILEIRSMGGGIFVYEALERAARLLEDSRAGIRHILLFADAADSEEPGDYKDLLAACRRAGITASVVGLGSETDTDAGLLKDIAARGGGNAFFTGDARELPRLFAQDTFIMARSGIVEDATAVRMAPAIVTLIGRDFEPDRPIGGYCLSYLRPDAQLIGMTLDDYSAPLIAVWHAGLGRVAAYTGEVDGELTGAIGGWADYGELLASLARWTIGSGKTLQDGPAITQELRDGASRVEIHLDPARAGEPFAELPQVSTVRARDRAPPRAERRSFAWSDLDTLEAVVPLGGGETVVNCVLIGNSAVTLPPTALLYSPEFQPSRGDSGEATLERLARTTGGLRRDVLSGTWEALPRRPRRVLLAPWLLLAAVAVLLLEVLERRTATLSRAFRRGGRALAMVSRRRPRKAMEEARPPKQQAGTTRPRADSPPEPRPADPQAGTDGPSRTATGMPDALRAARRKAKDHLEG